MTQMIWMNSTLCQELEGLEEVRRRILIGTFVLSHGYYDAYYSSFESEKTGYHGF